MHSNVKSLLLFYFKDPLFKRQFPFTLLSLLKSFDDKGLCSFVVFRFRCVIIVTIGSNFNISWRILVDRADYKLIIFLLLYLDFFFFAILGEVDKFALDNVEVLVHDLV